MVLTGNPAARLHDVLAGMKGQPGNGALRAAWATVLGVEAGDTPLLFRGVAEVAALPAAITHLVEAAPEDGTRNLQMEWRDAVANALSAAHQFDSATSNFTDRYTDATLLALRFAAGRINHEDAVRSLTRFSGHLV